MLRKMLPAMLAGLMLASAANAQGSAMRFRWQTGQVLTYRAEQSTSIQEEVGETKSNTASKLNLVKRWQVLSVDNAGVATMQLTLTSLRLETTTPGGETLFFDSANADKSNPQMREQMQRFVGQPLAVLRVDPRGLVVEVKESRHGAASRYQNELPFAIVLPEKEAERTWQRAYQITLDPPQGTGEKYDAVQDFRLMTQTKNLEIILLATKLRSKPESAADEIPLLQLQPQGQILFDVNAGVVRSVKMDIEREVKGHQGQGSSYRFQSKYAEDLVKNP